jgi:RND family efflux transporter MFP subunit
VGPEHPHPSTGGRALVAVVVGLILAGLVLALFARLRRSQAVRSERTRLETERDQGERITVARVKTTSPSRTLSLPGDVRGYNQVTLYAKVSGYVGTVRVERGQRVHHGDVLATIESPENEQAVAQAAHDYRMAEVNSRRYQSLAPSGVVSGMDRDNAVLQARASAAALGQARALLDYTVVRAPFDGIVSARYVDPGALVPAATAGTQSALALVDVADTSVVRIFAYPGQDAAPFIHAADPVVVWQDELPDRRIPAQVTFVSGALDVRTRTMQVEIDVQNGQWNLLPGTFAHLEIRIQEPPAPLIPDEAIVVRDGKTMVAVIDEAKAHYVEVALGYNDGTQIRVLRGLHGDELVGTNVPIQVTEGARVQASPPAESGDGGPEPSR